MVFLSCDGLLGCSMSVSDVSTAVLSQWVLVVSWRFGFFLACDKNWRFCLGGFLGGLFGFFFG